MLIIILLINIFLYNRNSATFRGNNNIYSNFLYFWNIISDVEVELWTEILNRILLSLLHEISNHSIIIIKKLLMSFNIII